MDAETQNMDESQPAVAFPIPCAQFVKGLIGTDDEIWSHLLLRDHRFEKHTEAEWRSVMDLHRHEPAHRT